MGGHTGGHYSWVTQGESTKGVMQGVTQGITRGSHSMKSDPFHNSRHLPMIQIRFLALVHPPPINVFRTGTVP